MSGPDDITIPVTLPASYAERLSALVSPDEGRPDLEAVISELLDRAQQGVYRPAAEERAWLIQAFGYDWLERLEPDDRPEMLSADGRVIFERPVRAGDDGSEEGEAGDG